MFVHVILIQVAHNRIIDRCLRQYRDIQLKLLRFLGLKRECEPSERTIAFVDSRSDENCVSPKRSLELHCVIAIRSNNAIVFVLNTLVVKENFLRAIVLTDQFYHVVLATLFQSLTYEPLIIIVLLLAHFDAGVIFYFNDSYAPGSLIKTLSDE